MTARSRRFDRQPETARDRRFFDLRESGYDGPIDQDGRAVTSRTDSRGRSLPLFKGGTGTGTPDDKSGKLARRRNRAGA
jgi:hypothetical protein